MSNNEPELEATSAEDARKINSQCNRAPKMFTYPADLPISEELRKQYAEIAAKLPKPKRRRHRR